MSKFTRGPWVVSKVKPEADKGYQNWVCASGRDQADDHRGIALVADKEDAKLIAASPEIYAEAKVLCDVYMRIYKQLPECYAREQLSVMIGRLMSTLKQAE